jgi:hypothetical protein
LFVDAEPKNCGFCFSSHNYSQPYEENFCQRNLYFDLSFGLGMLLKVSEKSGAKKYDFQGHLKKTPVVKKFTKTPKVASMLHLNY